MVKSKQLKLLRKQLASAMKCSYDVKDHIQLPKAHGDAEMNLDTIISTKPDSLELCLKLFERNMGELYKQSSWGLDLKEKMEEWTHRTSRFILLLSKGGDNEGVIPQLEAFVNYRFLIEDDRVAVLYVYELQVNKPRQGYGRSLMDAMESIASLVALDKVMLTVFRNNDGALLFYQRLGYQADETSPDDEDYLILSKRITKEKDRL